MKCKASETEGFREHTEPLIFFCSFLYQGWGKGEGAGGALQPRDLTIFKRKSKSF